MPDTPDTSKPDVDQAAAQTPRWLIVTPLNGVRPLGQDGWNADDRPDPDLLDAALFGTIAGGPGAEEAIDPDDRTFAILDAATYDFLPDLLEASELPHRCLFKGSAREELGDAAPWLVELPRDDPFTRKLLSPETVPGGMWDMELGVFFRTSIGFDALWSHVRKFTKMKDERGVWHYFRYWSPPVSTRLLSMGNLDDVAPMASPMFPAAPNDLAMLIFSRDMNAMLSRVPGTSVPRAQPKLTQPIRDLLQEIRKKQQFEEVIDICCDQLDGKTEMSDQDIRTILRQKRDDLFHMGFWRRDHLAKMSVWEILLGPDFVNAYANGEIKRILITSAAAHEAIAGIERLLQQQEQERLEAEEAANQDLTERTEGS